jgi:hypothetical protein
MVNEHISLHFFNICDEWKAEKSHAETNADELRIVAITVLDVQ